MPDPFSDRQIADEIWYWYLNGKNRAGFPDVYVRGLQRLKMVHHALPGAPRCLQCDAPMAGVGGWLIKPFGYGPSALTPRLCNLCEKMILKHEGGTEVELSLLFADIRGSTSMAEQKGTLEYREFIQRFFKAASKVLIERDALVNRLIGDQAIGLFVPAFSGRQHARAAIEAALEILRVTGHADPAGPWAPLGVGVHTGSAYVGSVGSHDGVKEIAVLGNAANLAARLSSRAAEGEVLVSEEAAAMAGITDRKLQKRRLKLKGITNPVPVRVMTLTSAQLPVVSN
jgi:adenylate cyclase